MHACLAGVDAKPSEVAGGTDRPSMLGWDVSHHSKLLPREMTLVNYHHVHSVSLPLPP